MNGITLMRVVTHFIYEGESSSRLTEELKPSQACRYTLSGAEWELSFEITEWADIIPTTISGNIEPAPSMTSPIAC